MGGRGEQGPARREGRSAASGARASGGVSDAITFLRLLDIEESVWSPQYGIKGKMDVTVLARVRAVGVSARTFAFAKHRVTYLACHTGHPTIAHAHARGSGVLWRRTEPGAGRGRAAAGAQDGQHRHRGGAPRAGGLLWHAHV